MTTTTKRCSPIIFFALLATFTSASYAEAPSTNPAQDILGSWTTGFMTDPQGVIQRRTIYSFDEHGACRFSVDDILHHPIGDSGRRETRACRYRIGAPVAQVPGAYEFDIDFHSFFITPLHQNMADKLNEDRHCGLTGWQLGIQRDVTGLTCGNEVKAPTGWQYNIVVVKKDDSIQFGLMPNNSPIGDTPDNRPTQLDPHDLIPRHGQGGIFNPGGETDERVPGFYHVVSYRKNTRSCDLSGATPANARYSHFELFPNTDIIPLASGWSAQTCHSVDECRQTPNRVALGGDFNLNEMAGPDRYTGKSTSATWLNACNATVQLTDAERAANGSLTIVRRTLKGVIPGIDTFEACFDRDVLINVNTDSFTCTEVLEIQADYLGR